MPADRPIEVLGLDGIPEVRVRDDLAGLIGDAVEQTAGALPLDDRDVLVVTRKVVSKAEGAIVDLTGIVPGADALEFAERYGRDARQVQVVLDEARRVVRMEEGVLITETPHGFVCANGGVDASNVGPDSGSLVTLLPRDPDASATGIRSALRARFGVDVAVQFDERRRLRPRQAHLLVDRFAQIDACHCLARSRGHRLAPQLSANKFVA